MHKNVVFENIEFPDTYKDILDHKVVLKWGIYVIPKLFGFNLIKKYKKVLFLDADMFLSGDLSDIFNSEEEMAWRKVIAWNPSENFKSLLSRENDYISAPNGGLIYFTDKLLKYNISDEDIVDAFLKIKEVKRGGIDERILAYLVYEKRISLKEIEVSYNLPAVDFKPKITLTNDIKIIHFLNYRGITTKPWKNLAAYLYFKDWAENYEVWISMGGSGLVSFTENDYYDLFGFKQADEIKKLKNKLKQKDEELEKLKNISRKYNIISNSKTWKATKPIRKIFDIIKKLK